MSSASIGNTGMQAATVDADTAATPLSASSAEGKQLARHTIDRVWLIVAWAAAVVLVGSFVTLAASVLVGGASAEMLLTVFTTVVGFVAGLLTPTPALKP